MLLGLVGICTECKGSAALSAGIDAKLESVVCRVAGVVSVCVCFKLCCAAQAIECHYGILNTHRYNLSLYSYARFNACSIINNRVEKVLFVA